MVQTEGVAEPRTPLSHSYSWKYCLPLGREGGRHLRLGVSVYRAWALGPGGW